MFARLRAGLIVQRMLCNSERFEMIVTQCGNHSTVKRKTRKWCELKQKMSFVPTRNRKVHDLRFNWPSEWNKTNLKIGIERRGRAHRKCQKILPGHIFSDFGCFHLFPNNPNRCWNKNHSYRHTNTIKSCRLAPARPYEIHFQFDPLHHSISRN